MLDGLATICVPLGLPVERHLTWQPLAKALENEDTILDRQFDIASNLQLCPIQHFSGDYNC